MSHVKRALLLTSACALLATACSDGNGSGPSVPDVSGLWTGTWRSAPVSLDLDQAGAELSGTLSDRFEDYSIVGEVSAEGVATWVSEVHPAECAHYFTVLGGMQLRAAGDSLVGVVTFRHGASLCDENAGGVVSNAQGDMALSRVAQ